MFNILFATSEAYPLLKTGGLADVAASLPRALLKLGNDVKIIMPAYESIITKTPASALKLIAEFTLEGKPISLLQTRLPGTKVTVLLVSIPEFTERVGNPYCGPDGNDWFDNHQRFYWFAKAAEAVALNRAGLEWKAEIVHCNDWQTGLIPALLSLHPERPATLFTIHNLAYRGLFSYNAFADTNLPVAFWHHERLEFYGQLSFIKGGLAFSDYINTVSPSYAQEIQSPEFGYGLDGLLRYRNESLCGILNGIDTDEWNPGTDKNLAATYNRRTIAKKLDNKRALQVQQGLATDEKRPLLGFIGRLVDQKGVDLILAQIPYLLANNCQLVVLGSGFAHYEQALKQLALDHSESIAVTIGYNEALAHQIEAGVDIFLMPSQFEPCGLNQMYSLRYGTLPIVHAVGGLKDTIYEGTAENGDGFIFTSHDSAEFQAALDRALTLYQQPEIWKNRQLNAMTKDYSWEKSAQDYMAIYQKLIE